MCRVDRLDPRDPRLSGAGRPLSKGEMRRMVFVVLRCVMILKIAGMTCQSRRVWDLVVGVEGARGWKTADVDEDGDDG